MKVTSSGKLFVSTSSPEILTADGFSKLEWIENGTITNLPPFEFIETYVCHTASTKTIKRSGKYTNPIGKIKKPKLARFGRRVTWSVKK